jgi:hypothetical protein
MTAAAQSTHAQVDAAWHARATRILTVLFLTAVAVSVVHYTDNTVNYDDFPKAEDLPNPSRTLVGASWFLFTAAGVAGYVLFRRAPTSLSLVLLAVYSGSGLVSIGHYTAPGALDMPVLRHAHVLADLALGLALLGFVLWVVRARGRRAIT